MRPTEEVVAARESTALSIDGLSIYGEFLERAPAEVRTLWQLAQPLLARDVTPRPASADLAARRLWAHESFAPWARLQWDGIRAVEAAAAPMLVRHGASAVFASVLLAQVRLHFVRGLVAAREAEADDETAHEWFPMGFAATLAVEASSARFALETCSSNARFATAPIDQWSQRCRDASRTLQHDVEQIVARVPREPAPSTADPDALPRECDLPREVELDDGVPPPDPHAPLETAILIHPGFGPGRNEHALWSATASLLRSWSLPAPIPEREISDAIRVWRASWRHHDPTACTPPHAWSLLTRRHRNLVAALVGPDCEATWRAHQFVVRGECHMIVGFRHLGTTDRTGLPNDLFGPVDGDLDDGRNLARALSQLPPAARPRSHEHDSFADDRLFLRVAPDADAASHTRVHAALFSEDSQEALASCASGSLVSYDVQWRLSPTGTVESVALQPIMPPPPSAISETRCMEGALRSLRFPCADSTAPSTLHARICLRSNAASR